MTLRPIVPAISGAEAPARRLWRRVLKHVLAVMLVIPPVAIAQESPAPETLAGDRAGSPRPGSVRLSTGVRLDFAESGDPAGPVVILLHGYGDSWLSFSRVLPLLSGRYRVFALDQRGHGRSEQPEGGYGMPDLARDVIAFLDAKGIGRAALVGHSMGSFVAQQVARLAPERVSGLVLIGSATGLAHLPNWIELRPVVLALTDPVSPDFARDFQLSTVHRPVPSDFMDQAIRESLRLPARVWHAVIEGMFAMPVGAGPGTATPPTLLMWGDRDAVFPRSELDALAALYPQATVIVYPEIGHAPHWEDPQVFVRDLEAFLGR